MASPCRGRESVVANSNGPEEDFNLLDYALAGPIRLLGVSVKLTGLFVLQYLFF